VLAGADLGLILTSFFLFFKIIITILSQTLENCDLSGSDLHEANLRGANLKGAAFELMLTPLHMSYVAN
jgi:uncharacterized protein YjbI with pentapeptide repeats